MEQEMIEYVLENRDEIISDLTKHEVEDVCIKHYSNYISAYHALEMSEGFSDKDSKKKIKKFVTSDLNILFLQMKQEIEVVYNEHFNEDEMYEVKRKQLKALLEIKTFEQRSPEWYAFRKKILTASDLATSFDKGHFNSRNDLILSKIDPQPWLGNQATEWGVKYEDVAIEVYERRNKVKVIEFGLVPHPHIDVFGASPDGIVADTGNKELTSRMLEIKCPWMRKIVHGEVPWHYWAQIQGQLDTCDLDYCDFVQVKLVEYPTRKKYLEDEMQEEKGLVISVWNNKEHIGSPKYHYCPIDLSHEEEEKWMEPFFDEEKYEIENITHWKIGVFSCFTVKRDKAWFNGIVPEIYRFNKDLKYWQEQGKDKLKKHIEDSGKKKKEYNFKANNGDYVSKLPPVCLID
jgi:putative phage-type endonuclease